MGLTHPCLPPCPGPSCTEGHVTQVWPTGAQFREERATQTGPPENHSQSGLSLGPLQKKLSSSGGHHSRSNISPLQVKQGQAMKRDILDHLSPRIHPCLNPEQHPGFFSYLNNNLSFVLKGCLRWVSVTTEGILTNTTTNAYTATKVIQD